MYQCQYTPHINESSTDSMGNDFEDNKREVSSNVLPWVPYFAVKIEMYGMVAHGEERGSGETIS